MYQRCKVLARHTRLLVSALLPAAALSLSGCAEGHDSNQASYELEELDMAVAPAPPRPISPLPAAGIADPAKVQLGKSLFTDPRLSADGRVSCQTCHDLRRGGDDGRRVSVGVDGRQAAVNAPSVLNKAYDFAYYWDGRARTLQEQIVSTVRSPNTMGGDWSVIERTLRDDGELNARFKAVYGGSANAERVADALAAYVEALVTPGSPFDRFLSGEPDALSKQARDGYALFVDLGCVSCHQGRNVGGNLYQRFGIMADYFADRGEITTADYGRYNVTGKESDRFKFKVPSLRNVAETAPYFHDGSADTLEEAVRAMLDYQLGRPAGDDEVEHIVAFLRSLSGQLDESLL